MDDMIPETLNELERVGDEQAVMHDAEMEPFVQLRLYVEENSSETRSP
jgi:hypothetical protein